MDPKEKRGNYQKLVAALMRRLMPNEKGDKSGKEKMLKAYYKALEKLKPGSLDTECDFGDSVLAEKIKRSLVLSNSSQYICRFEELHCRLQSGTHLKNREGVLMFLWHLGNLVWHATSGQGVYPNVEMPSLFHNVTFRRPMTPVVPRTPASFPTSQSVPTLDAWQPSTGETLGLTTNTASSLSLDSGTPSLPVPRDEPPRRTAGNLDRSRAMPTLSSSETAPGPLLLMERGQELSTPMRSHQGGTAGIPRVPMVSHKPLVSEHVLLQELIFSFQGIPGTILKLDPVSGGFKVDPQFHLRVTTKRAVQRLTELGWLHNRIKRFCDETEHSRTLGLMQKSLVSALRSQLTEYYRFVAVIQARAQLEQQQVTPAVDSPLDEETTVVYNLRGAIRHHHLTLRQLGVWAMEPTARLRCLLAVVEASTGRKGGELASAIYSFLQDGDPLLHSTTSSLLIAVCKPLYLMLSRWVVDGELEDRYGEFFIQAEPHVTGDRLWHDKYCVKPHLVPSFIPLAEAQKILATGKSINFLREVCQDHTPVHGRDMLHRTLETGSVEALFNPDHDGDLHQVMDAAYRETSRRVLDVLSMNHKFIENLHALRRYLLLGQGDFIRHLMEIVNPELCKPAAHLQVHHLWGILETAIRSTNAQFEDRDILRRLDVRLLEQNHGDIGWDVFTLDYHVSGPISTVFAPSASSYLMLFHTLWRNKRMEYVLADCWKQQTTAMRAMHKVQEAAPVLKRVHLLTAEMIHLVQQMQYYTLFEVIECSWHEMLGELGRAESLDGILAAHERFLNKVKVGALLDEESAPLAGQVRAIYDLVLQLQRLEHQLRERTLEELATRERREKRVEERGETGSFGTSAAEEQRRQRQKEDFTQGYLPHMHTKLRVLTNTYQTMVKQFLLDLAAHPNANLQLLSFRLDFNDHYKKRDSRLAAPYTYQHRRLSEMGHRSSLSSPPGLPRAHAAK